MVRTKADSSARKAVAAKAPRKALSSNASSSSSSLASPKAGKYAGGNSPCPRPVPDWQKGISTFFPKSLSMGKGKENTEPDEIVALGEGSSEAGCSSSGGSSSTSSSSSQGEKTQDIEDD